MRQLPQLQKLYEQHLGRGLHMFHVESQHHSFEQVSAFLKLRGVTFPSPILDWCDFPLIGNNVALGWGYDCAKLPRTYIIGVEGRVIWEGRFGYDEVLEQEQRKVRDPGLVRNTLSPGRRPAAKLFGQGRYGEALAEAQRQLGRVQQEQERLDGELIVRRAEELLAGWREQVERAREERRFEAALAGLKKIADGYKETASGREARDALAALERDTDVKRELEAARDLEGLFQKLGSKEGKGKDGLVASLKEFARERAGLRAAEEALMFVEGLE